MGVDVLLYLRFGLGPLRAAKRREEFSYGRTKILICLFGLLCLCYLLLQPQQLCFVLVLCSLDCRIVLSSLVCVDCLID